MIVRALLDTQIVVRGLLGIRRSACSLVFEALADGRFTAVVSPYILGELRAVLALPKLRARYGLTDDQVAELLDAYGRQAEMVGGMLVLGTGGLRVPTRSSRPRMFRSSRRHLKAERNTSSLTTPGSS